MKHNELLSYMLNMFNDLIYSDDFLEEFRIPRHFVRKSKLSMRDMVLFLLFNSKACYDTKLDLFCDLYPEYGFPEITKQGLSKARYGIRYELFQTLFEYSANAYYENISSRNLWKGRYHVFAVDGTTQEVPSSESTFAEFGKMSDAKSPDVFWTKTHASILYDVLEDVIVDAAIEKQNFSERELSRMHLARFTDLQLQHDSVVIFDRGYYSAELFRQWTQAGCNVLMRLSQTNSICRVDGDDVVTKFKAPDGSDVLCRVIKYTLSTGETECLITNIMDEDLTGEMFGELYFERWKIESKYYELKEYWKIEEFTGTGALAIKQDFFITLIYSNIAALVKHPADMLIEQNSKPTNTYRYKARKSFIIGKVRRDFVRLITRPFLLSDIDEMILESSKKRSQIQPNRTSKRKRHTRAKKHYCNRKEFF